MRFVRSKRVVASTVFAAVIAVAVWADHDLIARIGTVLGSLVCVLAFTFAAVYGWRSNWRATVAGRALMYAMVGFGLYSAQVTASSWSTLWAAAPGGYPFRLEVRLVLYFALVVTLANMVATLIKIQRQR